MSAMKSAIRELRQAVLTGMTHSRDKLHQLADHLTDHLDNVVRQVRARDVFDDAPGRPRQSASPGDGHIEPGDPPDAQPFPELGEPQIQDADLVDWDVVNAIDTHTGPNDATFWSGRIYDGEGTPIRQGTELGAQHLTESTHGETLEQIIERQGMTDRMTLDWALPSTHATWREVSTQLAQNASGDVRAYLGDVRSDSVWRVCEFPTLVRNDRITSITLIDAATGRILDVFAR